MPARRSQDGFTLVEMLVVLIILATLAATFGVVTKSSRERARERASISHMEQASVVVTRARDKEQRVLRDIVGAGSFAACTQDPLPPVAQLDPGCRAAWDAVNSALEPFVSPGTTNTANLFTDGAGRPILVDIRETSCGAPGDRLVAVHPTGKRSETTTSVTIAPSRYLC